ncbi:PhzF family phenazine biosynthesis protein, partial [Candidatus Bipolaricaulota bacterium]
SSPPQVAGVGVPFLMIAVRDRETLLSLDPDWGALCQVCEEMELSGVYTYAPGGLSPMTSLCARFIDPFSRYEDPFTGSACGAMAALALRNGVVAEANLIVEQGESVGRIGRATVCLHDVEKNILVGGSAARVLSGTICSPPDSSSGAT